MGKMKKCQSCRFLDKEKSSANWIVCPHLPLEVIKSGSSEKCSKYERNSK